MYRYLCDIKNRGGAKFKLELKFFLEAAKLGFA